MADKKSLTRRFYDEVISEGKLEVIDELAAEDVIDHEEGPPGTPEGRDGIKAFVSMFREAFPDLKTEVGEMLEDGDRVAAHVTLTGTHEGEFMGVPASGSKISVETIDIVRFDGDQVAEHWGVTDMMALMGQIGALPDPAA